jgi:SAM-dependent methyltransferase
MPCFPAGRNQKLTSFILPIVFFSSCLNSFKVFRNEVGFFAKNQQQAVRVYTPRLQFYDLKKNDTLVSIGAESGANEVVYGLLCDSAHFVLENISAKYLCQKYVDFSKSYYEKMFVKKTTATYTIQIGNDSSTLLPSRTFKKVAVENSLHEFSNPQKMMAELYRILKPGAALYLFEALSTPKNAIHGSCNKRLFSRGELLTLMQHEHFVLEKEGESLDVPMFKFRKE